MAKIGLKLRALQAGRVAFQCPGCDRMHVVAVRDDGARNGGAGGGGAWGWNRDADRPTFTPSVLVTYDGVDAGVDGAPPAVCHSFVTDGRIQFLGDCTHALAGQTVDLPDIGDD